MRRRRFRPARRGWRSNELRTPAQERSARLLGPGIVVAIGLFLVLSGPVARLAGDFVGTALVGAVCVCLVVALQRHGHEGRTGRRALLEGVASGVAVALVYWLVFELAPPRPWWLPR